MDHPTNALWNVADTEYWPLYLALVADRSLTHEQIDDAAARAQSWTLRHDLTELRCELYLQEGQYALALTAAVEGEQLSRNAGLNVVPACSAFLLAKLGRTADAEAAVEDALIRLDRVHQAQRPYRYLALALRELGRADEARTYACHAYAQAWADGPPHCRYWDLRDVRELLDSMGEPYPDLPVTDPATVKVPLEDEIRAFIATLKKTERRKGTG